MAFPRLPPLPAVPEVIDPDRWLTTINGQLFSRRVNATGTVQIDKHKYYIGRAYQGRLVILQVDAANQQFKVELANQPLKTLPIKGLEQRLMSFEAYLEFICQQAISAWRLIPAHPEPLFTFAGVRGLPGRLEPVFGPRSPRTGLRPEVIEQYTRLAGVNDPGVKAQV